MPHSKIKLAITAVVWALAPLSSLCTAQSVAHATNPQRATVYDLLKRYVRVQNDKPDLLDAEPGIDSEKVQTSSPARVVHFPADVSLGQLRTQDAGTVRQLTYWFHWTGTGEGSPEYLCEAKGDVRVPPGKRLILTVTEGGAKNLSGLSKLKPDDLYGLGFEPSLKGPPAMPRGGMKHIAHLSGLKTLTLNVRGLTHKDMEQIKAFRSLEYFHAPDSLTDSGLAHIAELASLKGLYIGGSNSRVTDAGLQHIAKLSSLEELYLKGERMGDFGLPFLRDLPRLKYLCLCGSNFTDNGMVHVKDISSLRILSFHESRCRITDAGLAHISQMPDLELLCLHGTKNITDAGIAHLAKMRSLRKLDIGSSEVTDRGLAHLAQIKTLESLSLPQDQKGITDVGLAHIGELPNLKGLHISRIHFIDPEMNRPCYTDKGLAELANCRWLEKLSIGSVGITDAGMDHVAKLTNLKSLLLFGCENVTDRGLAKLRRLKAMTSLSFTEADISIAGLNALNSLSRMERMHIDGLRRSGAVLDLSGMVNLGDLIASFDRESGDAFTDADLACFAGLRQLRSLQIGPCDFTDKGLASLAGLVNLETLNIGGLRLTDAAFVHLANMKQLRILNVSGAPSDKDEPASPYGGGITDRALSYLEGLNQLNILSISSEHVFSSAAVQRLREALPRLYSLDVNTGRPGPRRTPQRQEPPPNRQRRRPVRSR